VTGNRSPSPTTLTARDFIIVSGTVVHSVEQDEHPFRLLNYCPVLDEFGDSGG
jgi:hypothetical protein